eukprot:CAMPEP_0197557386 /NCGR_PEP_ID=MMETSP1320-20131121/17025_1 /TAXON_ID=91990 /ORGANISM="Bolidomonas sp., Strain RCC2347" /LENGTH=117 /DNA_ID=CAMNT_0043118611 /DNA_START=45 /DNA_END=394 /DNA_ORIENTATION=-
MSSRRVSSLLLLTLILLFALSGQARSPFRVRPGGKRERVLNAVRGLGGLRRRRALRPSTSSRPDTTLKARVVKEAAEDLVDIVDGGHAPDLPPPEVEEEGVEDKPVQEVTDSDVVAP